MCKMQVIFLANPKPINKASIANDSEVTNEQCVETTSCRTKMREEFRRAPGAISRPFSRLLQITIISFSIQLLAMQPRLFSLYC